MKRWLSHLRQQTNPKHTYLILAGICAAYAALALGNMTRWSIWFDEAFSAYLMRFNIADITHFTAQDVHPPFYYWLLKGWTNVFGLSELGIRSFSMVAGIVALVGVFMLVQRLFMSPRAALFATTLVALSPLVVRFGHEARMYTFILAIVVWATYLLVRAVATKPGMNRWWAGYAVLLAIGMLTHYYVALAWLAHWAWRFMEKRAGRIKQFWSEGWIWAHVIAIGMFAWWLPTAIEQFRHVQNGFWIPKISAYTPVDYVSNMLLYKQYGQAVNWWAVLLLIVVVAATVVLWRGYGHLVKRSSSGVQLLLAMAIVPPLILIAASMPPLTPTFMDRYVVFAQVALIILVGLAIAVLYDAKRTRRLATVAGALVVVCLLFGIGNVYYYGNYNKNSSTSIRVKEVMQQIEQASSSSVQPVIAASPWVYYEAVFYESDSHPVYFMDSQAGGYRWGSLAMLKERDDNKIYDIQEFAQQYRYVWYIDNHPAGDVKPPVKSWERITSVDAWDSIDGNVKYRASLFDTQP